MAERLTVQCPYCNFMMITGNGVRRPYRFESVVRSKRKGKRDG